MELFECLKRSLVAEGKDCSGEAVAGLLGSSAPSVSMLDLDDKQLNKPEDAMSAISGYCSSKEMKVPADDAALVRLVYDSFAEKCADVLRKLQGVSPFRVKSLCIAGPYASDAFLCRLIASECGMTVTSVQGNVSALGNAAVQAGAARDVLAGHLNIETYKPDTC